MNNNQKPATKTADDFEEIFIELEDEFMDKFCTTKEHCKTLHFLLKKYRKATESFLFLRLEENLKGFRIMNDID